MKTWTHCQREMLVEKSTNKKQWLKGVSENMCRNNVFGERHILCCIICTCIYICFDFINKNIVLFCESFSAAQNSFDFSNWWSGCIIPWMHDGRHARMLNDQLKKRNNTYEEERCLFFKPFLPLWRNFFKTNF